jgi:hypothetical protein
MQNPYFKQVSFTERRASEKAVAILPAINYIDQRATRRRV